jgi:hypothetical protein
VRGVESFEVFAQAGEPFRFLAPEAGRELVPDALKFEAGVPIYLSAEVEGLDLAVLNAVLLSRSLLKNLDYRQQSARALCGKERQLRLNRVALGGGDRRDFIEPFLEDPHSLPRDLIDIPGVIAAVLYKPDLAFRGKAPERHASRVWCIVRLRELPLKAKSKAPNAGTALGYQAENGLMWRDLPRSVLPHSGSILHAAASAYLNGAVDRRAGLRLLMTTASSLRELQDRGLLRMVVGHESQRALLENEDAIGHDRRVELGDAE